ncbi:MAG: Phaeocystis globosa virus, partial [Cyanobacteriota bacterium]
MKINDSTEFTMSSQLYLDSLDRNYTRKNGIVYTPVWLASHITTTAFIQWEKFNRGKKATSACDLCCGTGSSTYNDQLGIDTSKAMIEQAQKIHSNSRFIKGNAENYGQHQEFDTATLMFAFHEMPNYAHHKIIKNAKKITKHDILIVDISPNYSPSKLMLSGEPYLLNYKATIHD